jgi:hypothetical protein
MCSKLHGIRLQSVERSQSAQGLLGTPLRFSSAHHTASKSNGPFLALFALLLIDSVLAHVKLLAFSLLGGAFVVPLLARPTTPFPVIPLCIEPPFAAIVSAPA